MIVVYDQGAVNPLEAMKGTRGIASLTFAAPDSDAAKRLLPVMRQLGNCVSLSHDHESNVNHLRALQPQGIVTFSEAMLRPTAAIARSLKLLHHSEATIEYLTDKISQRERLLTQGVDSTAHYRLRSLPDWDPAIAAVGLPAVLKPANGGASRDTYLINEAAKGRTLINQLFIRSSQSAEFILEGFIPDKTSFPFGSYVSVESMVVDGSITHLAITGKLPLAKPFRETGEFWPALLTSNEELRVRALAKGAIEALEVKTGLVHTEIKLTPCGPRILEVNGRLGGFINELSLRTSGVDLVSLAARIALQESPEPPQISPAKVMWQCYNPAPLQSCKLVETLGWRESLRIPGITGYTAYVRPGEMLSGGVVTKALDLVVGEADDYEQMCEQLARLGETLTYVFDFDGGRRVMPSRDLAHE